MDEAMKVIGAVSMAAAAIFAGLAWWNARHARRKIEQVDQKLDPPK